VIHPTTRYNEAVASLIRWAPPFAFLLCMTAWNSPAQNADAQIAKKLAGTQSHEWVFQRWETFMGPGNRCKQGESYRFTRDHQVMISTCIEGHVKTETKPWSLDTQDPMEAKIQIGETSYVLIFWDKKGGHFMTLRTKPIAKTDKTVDKDFQLLEE
jgi:hypothetical protein